MQDFLNELPLNSYERAVVLALSRVDGMTATKLVKAASVPQGRIYSVLNSLVSKGIAVLVPTRPKQYRIPDVKIALSEYLERTKQELEEKQLALAKLTLSEKTISPQGPSVAVFTGRDEHLNTLIMLRNSAKKELLQSAPLFIGSFASNKALVNALKRGVKVRVIIREVNKENAKAVKQALLAGAQIRRSKQEDLLSIMIKDNEEVLIGVQDYKRDEERLTILCRNKPLLAAIRDQFENEWKKARKIKN